MAKYMGSSLGTYGVINALDSLISPNQGIESSLPYEKLFPCFIDPNGSGNRLNSPKTIAETTAKLLIPELQRKISNGEIVKDGLIVDASGSISVHKISVQPVWNLKNIARKYQISLVGLQNSVAEALGAESISNELEFFIPPLAANTIYVFSQARTLNDINFSTADVLRIHDECNSSDVFGSDMCSCRPYLIDAIEKSVVSAQSGGLGLIAYMRNEGRALGEVNKFEIYRQRNKDRGDPVSSYFNIAQKVAGKIDNRLQDVAAELFFWLGVRSIRNLVSMSPYKKKALRMAGITFASSTHPHVDNLPAGSLVEILAKQASGYR